MNLSKKFEELIVKQLESFGCSMGVTNLVMYLASAKQGTKASFEISSSNFFERFIIIEILRNFLKKNLKKVL